MILRGVNFGPVLDASGVRGFFGEGYWYHTLLTPFGLDFKGSTFVAKTTTLEPRAGNMPLAPDGITPLEWKPRCIVVNFWDGSALNAVGLSGPGAKALFERKRWQRRKEPFMISFMSVALTAKERVRELADFLELFDRHLRDFWAPVGLQLNYTCPNVTQEEISPEMHLREINEGLDLSSGLRIPLIVKLNLLTPVPFARSVSEHRACDALCVSNTIPWGALPEKIFWAHMFGSHTSPLESLGGGGLSGWPLHTLVYRWVTDARSAGITKPINAGGGILSPDDVDDLASAGASSVFLGSVAFLRGWRVRRIIARARECENAGRFS